jgi:putative FmdB family regulatory protein
MPIYEYGCAGCGRKLEVQQKVADPPLTTCPECGAEQLEKLISATAFVLKGGGWYKDGYGKKEGGERTDNQRTDRLQKAIDDDKKKTAATASGGGDSSTSSGTSSSDSGGGGGSKGDGGKSASAPAP